MSVALTYFIAYITEALIAYYYLHRTFNKEISNSALLLAYTLSYGIQYLISFSHIININIISFMLTNFLLIFLLYKTSILIAFLHSVIMTIMMGFGELITNSLLGSIIYHYDSADMRYSIFIMYFIISKLFYYILLLIVSRFFHKKNTQSFFFDKSSFLLLTVPILSLILMSSLFYISSIISLTKTIEQIIILNSFCILLINILIVFLFEYIQDKQYKIAHLELEIQREADSRQYNTLLEQQDINQKILVHDIKHHLQNIQQLQHLKDYSQAEQYINNILKEPSLVYSFKPTQNNLLNIILSQYIVRCSEKNINLKIDAQNTNINFLSSADITALFCNLLDNAVEASEHIPEAMIEFKITDKEEVPLTVISITNSCRTAPKKNTHHSFLTTKEMPERHGFGTRSIHRIVDKYTGSMETYFDENKKEFHTIIMLPVNHMAADKFTSNERN